MAKHSDLAERDFGEAYRAFVFVKRIDHHRFSPIARVAVVTAMK
ncbi:hypothetical protein [Bradyrhizobium sp. SZCCHNR1051]|nr:hypothetical protein [Bradyrhizobium sp. SZCCHNR1051]